VSVHKSAFKGILFSSLCFLIMLPACWWSDGGNKLEKLRGLVVINVLDRTLHNDCHIKGSINVSLEDLERYAQSRIDKDADIVFYCSNYMCSSSGFARKRLAQIGFKNLSVYEGGTAEWYQLGYPVVGPAESSYLKKKMRAPDEKEPYVLTAQELKKKIDEYEKRALK